MLLSIRMLSQIVVFLGLLFNASLLYSQGLLTNEGLQKEDAVFLVQGDQILFEWQADKALIPASITKIVSAQLAIDKWGLQHRFHTDFYQSGKTLWVKGYGDPFLISEEIDLLVGQLNQYLDDGINKIAIDASYFESNLQAPGRSKVSDPYNAPLSAVAANFNTAKLVKNKQKISSAEPQTPLTNTAKIVARNIQFSNKAERVNLLNADNAQQHFAEILRAKLNRPALAIQINASVPWSVPRKANLIYRHTNTRPLANILRGALEYSNNFIANQVFIKLAETNAAYQEQKQVAPLSFASAQSAANDALKKRFGWPENLIEDGAGLSRVNRLSARQIDQALKVFSPNKQLLKEYKVGANKTVVYAKTGTLQGVRTFAGYIELDEPVRFVLMFNRNTPWRYRETLLERIVTQLLQRKTSSSK